MKKEYLIYKLSDQVKSTCKIDNELFSRYGVKRGLRNEDGSGVLVGLTNIGNVVGYDRDETGQLLPAEGKLYYRGYELNDLVSPLLKEQRFGFEEIAYLLLSGKLPDREELTAFRELLNENMPLDHRTVVHLVDLEGTDIMNILARCVLEMYTFDENPDDISRDNLMRQAVESPMLITSIATPYEDGRCTYVIRRREPLLLRTSSSCCSTRTSRNSTPAYLTYCSLCRPSMVAVTTRRSQCV